MSVLKIKEEQENWGNVLLHEHLIRQDQIKIMQWSKNDPDHIRIVYGFDNLSIEGYLCRKTNSEKLLRFFCEGEKPEEIYIFCTAERLALYADHEEKGLEINYEIKHRNVL